MTRLPLTVIGGYLGAGKTTLINRLLTDDHGKRLMVMVNDFGAVNIDAALIRAQGADTLELTNGCVCCTMGADLFMAVGDVLDRPERPEHLIIEASGIADPARIAEVARNEPDLSYAGILTVVDGLNFSDLLQDAQIAPQLESQVAVADLVMVSKVDPVPDELLETLKGLGVAGVLAQEKPIGPLLWGLKADIPDRSHAHGDFSNWLAVVNDIQDRNALVGKLRKRPKGLYRLKGFVRTTDGLAEVQVVGKSVEVIPTKVDAKLQLVGIGPKDQFDLAAVNAWWAEA